MSLKQLAIHGVKWSSFSQFGRQIIQLITTAILARMLTPSDFGLMSMAAVVIGFAAIFNDLGTSAAVIHRNNLSEELLSSIFWINICFGIISTIVLIIISPWAARFYNDGRVSSILMLLSLSFIISGLSILHHAMLEKELAFSKLAKIEIAATLAGSVVGLSLAIFGFGVWSLVFQSLITGTLITLLLWLTCRWRPKLIFSLTQVKSVSSYSLNLTGFNIFNYFTRNADNLLIGRYLGAQYLGYYNLAYLIMMYPLQNISSVVGRVMFPVFSQIQEDDAFFRSAYLKVASAIALITFPLMIGLWVIAKPFILTIFGPQWSPVIIPLLILSPVGMIQSIITTAGTIYQVKGRTDWFLRWGIFAGILVVVSFVIGLRWGIIGVATAYAFISFILIYPSFAIPFRLIDLKVRDLGRALWRPLSSSLTMAISLLALMAVLPSGLPNGLILGIMIPCGVLVYLIASWMINQAQMRQVLDALGIRM